MEAYELVPDFALCRELEWAGVPQNKTFFVWAFFDDSEVVMSRDSAILRRALILFDAPTTTELVQFLGVPWSFPILIEAVNPESLAQQLLDKIKKDSIKL